MNNLDELNIWDNFSNKNNFSFEKQSEEDKHIDKLSKEDKKEDDQDIDSKVISKAKKTEQRYMRMQHTKVMPLNDAFLFKRAYSETQLLDCFPDGFKKGYSYNCMTGGDVDALSYLKLMLRQQDLDYLLISTWCMGIQDVFQLIEWIKNGRIKKCDMYLGEVFKNRYKFEYELLKKEFKECNPTGRIIVFRNHSKIFAGYGNKFHFGIQMSCNINTNPRCENACISLNKDLFDFYVDFFSEQKNIVKE